MTPNENIIYIVYLLISLLIANIATYIKNPSFTISLDSRDCMFFLGIILVGAGAWMIYQPAGLISSGLLLFWTARPR
ncbi:hypothetical protein ABD07_00350 [Nitrosomonas oligotropha]|nr:hypothetical protein [Nitrosomonas oligotropha]